MLLHTALRLHELSHSTRAPSAADRDVGALLVSVDDVSISVRNGLLIIGSGKGDLYLSQVPLNPPCRQAFGDWLSDRAAAQCELALLVRPQDR